MKRLDGRGLTLVEVLVVVVVMGIIAAIAVPTFLGLMEKTEQDVCDVNVMQVERAYERFLVLEGIEHGEVVFSQFLVENGLEESCGECVLGYVEGEVVCDSRDKSEDEAVPFF